MALRHAADHCRCERAQRSGGIGARFDLEDFDEDDLTMSLGSLVTDILAFIQHERELDSSKRGRLVSRTRYRRAWPGSVEELLPVNPDIAIHMLGLWIYLLADEWTNIHPVMRLMTSIMSYLHSYAVLGILKTPTVWKWIHHNVHDRDSNTKLDRNDPDLQELIFCAVMIGIIARELHDDELEVWVASDYTLSIEDVINDLSKMITILMSSDSQTRSYDANTTSALSTVMARLLMRIPSATPRILPGLVRRILTRFQSSARPVPAKLNDLMFGNAWIYRCYGPACLAMPFALGALFKVCGGCRVAQYCSRSCQKRAWRHTTAPHRSICTIYHAYNVANKRKQPAGQVGDFLLAFPDRILKKAHENVEALRSTQFAELSKMTWVRPVNPF
jgi:hypothetical protein